MSNSADASRPRGRPRGFDLDAATIALERALWARGYFSVSVEELAADAGLSLSSLYAAYGNKQGVLEATLGRYEHEMGQMLDELEHGDRGIDDIEAFLARVGSVLDDPDSPSGCFMVNTMIEIAESIPEVADLTRGYRRRVEVALTAALDRAALAGEVARNSAHDRARLLQAALFGVLTTSRAGEVSEARAGLHALVSEIRRWTDDQTTDPG